VFFSRKLRQRSNGDSGATLFHLDLMTPLQAIRQQSAFSRYALIMGLGACAAIAAAAAGQAWPSSQAFWNGLISLFALALAAEMTAVKWQVGSAAFSMAFIPLLAAAFLFPPVWAMILGGATQLLVGSLVRKKSWDRVLFNTSKEILAVGSASIIFGLLGGHATTTEFQVAWFGILGAGLAYSSVDSFFGGYAVSLLQGRGFRETWLKLYGGTIVYDVFASPIPALLAYLYVRWQLLGVVYLTAPLFIVRHIYLQNLRLEQSTRELLELMVKNIEARDPYTSGHSQRVSEYARLLAKEAGVPSRQVEQIATAALLHDVGKTYEEYGPLLRKEGRLTPDERKLLQTHPVRSAELITTISSFRGPVERAVRHHHENFDGTGYPEGLVGEDIPLGARVIMVADTLDAMTTDRPYRSALSFETVLAEVRKYSGKQFDPRLADIVMKSSGIRRLVSKSSPAAISTPAALDRAAPIRPKRAVVLG
jgi:HD-GYP domain-containing protein (c-di-GMP phosphodiesterase class II)